MDISLVTTQDLLAELLSRFDVGVVSLIQHRREEDDFSEQYVVHQWVGHELVCLGLVEQIKLHILDSLESDSDDDSDDEDYGDRMRRLN
jgi:hypothetical protein